LLRGYFGDFAPDESPVNPRNKNGKKRAIQDEWQGIME
jgi:hypothetical protein